MNAMGIYERSVAGDHNPVADHVATIGQDKTRLLPGVPAAPARMAAGSAGDGEKGWELPCDDGLFLASGVFRRCCRYNWGGCTIMSLYT